MTDTKRTKLEKNLEALTTRHQAKSAQLAEARADLAAIKENLSIEPDNAKWEQLTQQHNAINIRIAALVDELAVLADKIRLAQLALNDFDLAMVNAEMSQLITEGEGLRVQAAAKRETFRKICSLPGGNTGERQAAILDIKTEIAQLEIAGGLTTQQIEAARRRRDKLTEAREAIA